MAETINDEPVGGALTSPELLIRGTFIHLPGVGPRTEEGLWRQGITSWREFVVTPKVRGMSPARKAMLDRALGEAEEALSKGRYDELVRKFPSGELWRLLPLLAPGARYLDIETEGLTRTALTTVVGISRPGAGGMISKDGLVHRALIRNIDLTAEEIAKALSGATVIVTFNGSTFDLPVLRREFGDILPNIPHIDLRHLSRRAGLTGGLKSLEHRLGIHRDAEVQMLAGDDAVRLWRVWDRKGHKRALELLVDYNKEDVMNLAPLSMVLYQMMGIRHITKVRSVAGQGPAPKRPGPRIIQRIDDPNGPVQSHLLQSSSPQDPA